MPRKMVTLHNPKLPGRSCRVPDDPGTLRVLAKSGWSKTKPEPAKAATKTEPKP